MLNISNNFEVVSPLIGGAILGLGSIILLVFNGRIMGCSGIFSSLFLPSGFTKKVGLTIMLGLVAGGILAQGLGVKGFEEIEAPFLQIVLAGFLVGFGAKIGNGCTSGHGICGVSRISKRSIWATLTFMASGFITVYITNLLGV